MTLRLDSRQSRQRSTLDQLSNSSDLRLDTILNLINDQLTMPLRMRASAVADQKLYIDSINVNTLDDSVTPNVGNKRNRTIPPIGGTLPGYSGGGYLTFNASTGAITATGLTLSGTPSLPSMTNGQWVKVVIWINSASEFGVEVGIPAASLAAAAVPSPPSDAFALGYVVVSKDAVSYSTIQDQYIYQFEGGGGSGGGSGASKEITQANSFAVGDVVYHDGSVYAKAQADTSAKAEAIGVVSKASSTKFTLTELGYVSNSAFTIEGGGTMTAGVVYFLSSTTAGKLTAIEPSVTGQISKPMFIADGATSGYVLNYRGAVVGSVNARVEHTLVNGGSKNIYTAPVGLEAAELKGWIYIDATTDYRFHVSAQFAKNGLGTDWNLAYQTAGDTPPSGFSMAISNSGVISVTLPSLAGYASSKINYSINGPAIGAGIELNIDSSKVNFTNIQAATASGLVFKEDGGTVTGTVSDEGNWVLSGNLSTNGGIAATLNDNVTSEISIANSTAGTTAYSRFRAYGASYSPLGSPVTPSLLLGVSNDTDSPHGTGNLLDQGSSHIYTSSSNLNISVGSNFSINFIPSTTLGPAGSLTAAGVWNLGRYGATTSLYLDSSTVIFRAGGQAVDATIALETDVGGRSSGISGNRRRLATTSQVTGLDFNTYNSGSVRAGYITGSGSWFQLSNSASWSVTSDIRVKENIRPVSSCLEKMISLNPCHFEYKNKLGVIKTGFIAQEFEQVLPGHVVETDAPEEFKEFLNGDNKMKALDQDLIPYLVGAIKELKAELDEAKAEIIELKAK